MTRCLEVQSLNIKDPEIQYPGSTLNGLMVLVRKLLGLPRT